MREDEPGPSTDHFNTTSSHSVNGLEALPLELLLKVAEHLPPSSVVALTQSSPSLYQNWAYSVQHIHNARGSVYASDSTDLDLHVKLDAEKYSVSTLLDRDRMRRLIQIDGIGSTCCSVCVASHPRECFGVRELETSPHERTCLAAAAGFRMCAHWRLDLKMLRGIKKSSICSGSRKGVAAIRCACFDVRPGTFRLSKSVITHELLACQWYDVVPVRHVADLVTLDITAALQAGDITLCEHITIRDARVARSFSTIPISNGVSDDNNGSGKCDQCDTEWTFVCELAAGSHTFVLSIAVLRWVNNVKAAWDPRYLSMVQGGDLVRTIAAEAPPALKQSHD